jgi:diaminopimelate epimerase
MVAESEFKNCSTAYIRSMFRRFVKYHGSGNDFVVVRGSFEALWPAILVAEVCHRRYGVGADGFMVVGPTGEADFRVDYYNADGQLGSLCGNGSRCAVDFARSQGWFTGSTCTFTAADGVHEAEWHGDGRVSVHFADAPRPVAQHGGWFVDTGSPHHVAISDDLAAVDAVVEGRALRFGVYAASGGANINWLSAPNGRCSLRTYERGVEDETLSCGTGAVAAALVAHMQWGEPSPVVLDALGGQLEVAFTAGPSTYTNIVLTGPVARVFDGEWTA